ncbi:MAG: bifunctional folylpolyglutamate synthase/dihydrofolate synthase, partial [Thermogutta sp.]|nr:bifunctional folylpolyglutamate synthase/dihydrofolate synthase [Thermogutta sp.]
MPKDFPFHPSPSHANQPPGELPQSQLRAFLLGRTNYERTVPGGSPRSKVFKLSRTRELLDRLGNPDRGYPILHVTGTKGKGSTAGIAAGILQAAGYRVGAFTSPHLWHVEERLAVQGRPCPPEHFDQVLEEIWPIVREMDADWEGMGEGGPTYFEILTAMAALYFARQGVDLAVLEVGLGGRLDATNVCRPAVSVITSISYDHTDILGTSLKQIAWEKAGIIKRGTPVVSGVTDAEPKEVIRRVAAKRGAPWIALPEHLAYRYRPPRHLELGDGRGWVEMEIRLPEEPPFFLQSELRPVGEHQARNAMLAVAALRRLQRDLGFRIPPTAYREALANVAAPARIEVVRRKPVVVIDAAHNVASAEVLCRTLNECFDARRKWAVFGTTQGKDYEGMLRLLAS